MKALWAAAAVIAPCALLAQGPPSQPAQPDQSGPPGSATQQLQMEMKAPQISITIKEHQFGPDMVTVTALKAAYPPQLLAAQCTEMGRLTGIPSRGLQVYQDKFGGSAGQEFTRATFATDGLIDRPNGTIRLEPIIRAFAGAPEGQKVESIMVTFDGERPTSKLLRSFADSSVVIAGSAISQPAGIEYRIMLRTQDPAAIKVPGESLPIEAARPKPPAQPGMAPALPLPALALIIVGGLIFAVLVYFLSRSLPRR